MSGEGSKRPERVSLPVELRQTREGWEASLGRATGTGSSKTEARADLADKIMTALNAADDAPSFAWDDQGALLIAIPDGLGGHDEWRVTADRATDVGSGDGPAYKALNCIVGVTFPRIDA